MSKTFLRRVVLLMLPLVLVGFIGADILRSCINRPPGDYETRLGSQRLEDGRYEEALSYYDQALKAHDNHRGALMGKALVSMRQGKWQEAAARFDYLINHLRRHLGDKDETGRGALAAAYANLGIAYDRLARYEKALENYIQALETDQETVSGPGVIHKILYGPEHVSTVRDRARYLYEQLQLPEQERLIRIPEIDARQRMYKP